MWSWLQCAPGGAPGAPAIGGDPDLLMRGVFALVRWAGRRLRAPDGADTGAVVARRQFEPRPDRVGTFGHDAQSETAWPGRFVVEPATFVGHDELESSALSLAAAAGQEPAGALGLEVSGHLAERFLRGSTHRPEGGPALGPDASTPAWPPGQSQDSPVGSRDLTRRPVRRRSATRNVRGGDHDDARPHELRAVRSQP
jgi:hypothetical protein